MQIGIDSFAASIPDPITGAALSPVERMQHLLEEIALADQVGLDVFGIGEHHRPEFLDSAPPVILGAAAALTKRIRLTSAVTVLSAADPVRVFQQFATLDLISQGRAEIVAGRGSFIESFPLVRPRPQRLRLALRRETGIVVADSRKDRGLLVGQAPRPAYRTEHLSAPRAKSAAHLDGSRRHPCFLRSCRYAGTSFNGCHHRRRTSPLSSPHRTLSRGRAPRGPRP